VALKDEALLLERTLYESFTSVVRQVTASADIGDLLALTDGADSAFGTRRAFSEAVSVGESTVAGWIKDARMPPLGKAVVGLLFIALQLRESVIEYERESTNLGDMIVRDGDCYMIVNFRHAGSIGLAGSIGEIAARNIPNRETAARLVSHRELRQALKLAIREMTAPAARKDPDFDDLVAYFEALVDDVSNEASTSSGRDLKELKDLAEEILSEEADIDEGEGNA
jgi:hypothetical protein